MYGPIALYCKMSVMTFNAPVPEKQLQLEPTAVWPAARFLATARGGYMAFRDCGERSGECWLVLHGGPGGAGHPGLLQPLQLNKQRAILPDQRGAGESRPRARLAGNHTEQLVGDLELLRLQLGIERWAVMAGSWGTVVALRYAHAHPTRVKRLVLRGAFALTRAEIYGLLRPHAGRDCLVWQSPHWPKPGYGGLPWAFLRLKHLLQYWPPTAASRNVIRCWNLLEQRSALRGLWRSLVHSAVQQQNGRGTVVGTAVLPALPAYRAAWALLKRQQRVALAGLQNPLSTRADKRGWQKFRIQGHYLQHRGFVPAGGLNAAVRSLAVHGIASDWVHGRFDAVCPPSNSRRWPAQQAPDKSALASRHWPLAGHLASEPAIRLTLAQVVRNTHAAF